LPYPIGKSVNSPPQFTPQAQTAETQSYAKTKSASWAQTAQKPHPFFTDG
jgi:hypothetical protein